jgi:hypothetical protein
MFVKNVLSAEIRRGSEKTPFLARVAQYQLNGEIGKKEEQNGAHLDECHGIIVQQIIVMSAQCGPS